MERSGCLSLLPCCCGCGDHTAPGYNNTTTVLSYDDPPGANIPPYTRPLYEIASGACVGVVSSPGDPVAGDQGFDRSFISPNAAPPGITAGGTVTVDLNGYEASGSNVTITNPCYGWKAVAAKAVWPGRFGFLTGSDCCPTGGQTQTKYTTITETEHSFGHFTKDIVSACEGTATVNYEEFYETDITQTATVDAYGNITRTGSMSFVHWFKTDGVLQPDFGTTDGSGVVQDICDFTSAIGTTGGSAGDPIPGGTTPAANFAPAAFMPFSAACGAIIMGGGDPIATRVPAFTGTAAEITAAVAASANPYENFLLTISDSELHVEWASGEIDNHYESNCEGGEGDDITIDQTINVTYEKTITLSGAITYDSVKDDAKYLLSLWPLGDDAIYPWRYDASTWLVPLVSRDAFASAPTILWTVDEECNFTNEGSYTGAIRGAPNPAGYDRHFNFIHKVWAADSAAAGTVCAACEESIGELSASPLPATAMQWTDKGTLQGPNMHGPGGWMTHLIQGQYGSTGSWPDAIDDGVTMQKWAETIESWPALNFARPCARDRYLFEEDATACIVDWTAPDLEINTTPAVEFEVADLVVIEDGVYEVAGKADAQNYTIGARLYDALIENDGVAKLRFATARAVCGQLAVAAVQSSPGVVTITVPRKHWLKRGGSEADDVDFVGVAGLGSGLEATVVDDLNFTVPGTLGAYAGGGFVKSTGAPADIEDWDTTCPRRKYITREFQSRFREYDPEDPEDTPSTVTETERDYTFSESQLYVVVISPNSGDSPARGVRYDFGDIDHDQCHGETWHMDVVQAVPDPFWQANHEPCDHSGEWSQAEAPCAEDADHWPYPPLVEAALEDPVGAPTLPVTLYEAGVATIPGPVSHPNCVVDPYDRGTLHAIRAEWEACDDWREWVNDNCV